MTSEGSCDIAEIETMRLKKCLLLVTVFMERNSSDLHGKYLYGLSLYHVHQVKTQCKGKEKTELAGSLLVLRKDRERAFKRERGIDEAIHHPSVFGSDAEPHATPHKSHSNCQSCRLPSPISLFLFSLSVLSVAFTPPPSPLPMSMSPSNRKQTHTITYCIQQKSYILSLIYLNLSSSRLFLPLV